MSSSIDKLSTALHSDKVDLFWKKPSVVIWDWYRKQVWKAETNLLVISRLWSPCPVALTRYIARTHCDIQFDLPPKRSQQYKNCKGAIQAESEVLSFSCNTCQSLTSRHKPLKKIIELVMLNGMKAHASNSRTRVWSIAVVRHALLLYTLPTILHKNPFLGLIHCHKSSIT